MQNDFSAAPLASELAGDPDLADLIELFVSEMPQRLEALEEAAAAADLASLATLAHQLKGSAGGYGYPGITAAAAHLEACARHRSSREDLVRATEDLRELCRRAEAALKVPGG